MKVIGITGGVGSGKSAVLTYLNTKYGAVICQLDDVAKKLQKKGTRCYQSIIEAFGEQILAPSGELDRKALGKIVFQNEEPCCRQQDMKKSVMRCGIFTQKNLCAENV